MSEFFLGVVNLSITASWLILAVIVARPLMKRAPKWIVCALWALVAIRLCLPISIESKASLVPSAETVPQNVEMMPAPRIDSGIPIVNEAVNPAIAESSLAPAPEASMNPLQLWVPVASAVWLTGIAAMLIYALVSYLRVRRTVAASIPAGEGVRVCDEIKSPFILGIVRPTIYLPSKLPMNTVEQVLAHERAHLARHDHWWKPLGYAILSFYWFNPLCWVAYILLCRDIELACDEKVIRDMDRESVAAYSQALLDCSLNRRVIAACPLAFGEVGVKERVKAALSYKKPAFWIIIAAIVVSIVIAVCFMTNPSKKLEGKLGVSMDMAVAEHNDDKERGEFFTYSAKVFRIDSQRGSTTVYAWVLSEGFGYEDGEVITLYGSSVPVAVTFDTSDNSDSSTYPVLEYWEPRDGSYYAEDIRAKFPASIQAEAMNQDSYVGDMKLENFNTAYDYFIGNPKDGNGVFKLTKWTVSSARAFNQFEREGDFALSKAQINVLIERANGIKRLVKSDEYAGFTPAYQICVKLSGTNKYSRYEYIYFNGYSAERDMVEVIFNNERYVVEDNNFAAYLRSVTSGGAALTYGTYKYNDSALTINSDGTAQLIFSPISSYIYIGNYSVDGDRLDVGGYIFTITEEGLRFNADESPEYVWGGFFRDGSVFRLDAEPEWFLEWAYKAILDGTKSFIAARTGEEMKIDGITRAVSDDELYYYAPSSYALVDLDRDGDDECVLYLSSQRSGDAAGTYAVIYEYGGEYYCAVFGGYDRVTAIKSDGTITLTDGSANRAIFNETGCALKSKAWQEGGKYYLEDNGEVSQRVYENYMGIQRAKDDAKWYSLVEKNYSTRIVRGGYVDSAGKWIAFNSEKLAISSVRHLPIRRFDTKAQLDNNAEKYGFTDSVSEALSKYNEAFFAENSLITVCFDAGSTDFRYDVESVTIEGGSFTLSVYQTNSLESYNSAMQSWFVICEVPDADLALVKDYDAVMTYRAPATLELPEKYRDSVMTIGSDFYYKPTWEWGVTTSGADSGLTGWLASFDVYSEEEYRASVAGDMSGVTLFGWSGNAWYALRQPTDLTFEKGDLAEFEEIQEWFWREGISEFLKEHPGITPVKQTNTLVDIYLARAAYGHFGEPEVEYGGKSIGKAGDIPDFYSALDIIKRYYYVVGSAAAPDSEPVTVKVSGARLDFWQGTNIVRLTDGYNVQTVELAAWNGSSTPAGDYAHGLLENSVMAPLFGLVQDPAGAMIQFNGDRTNYFADSVTNAMGFAGGLSAFTYEPYSGTPKTDTQDVRITAKDGTVLLFFKNDETLVKIDNMLLRADEEWRTPYYIARQWLDHCELAVLPIVDYAPDFLKDPIDAAKVIVENVFEPRPYLSENSVFKFKENVRVKISGVSESGEGNWAFFATVFFTPDGDRAYNSSETWAGNTITYEEHIAHGGEALEEEPPEGTLVMHRVGYVKKTDTGWRGEINGTG